MRTQGHSVGLSSSHVAPSKPSSLCG
jgi:hypothetical protein